ncbi:ZYRO0E05544p [Zygosaccharomyces rouxii]|uniref:ZYRO0E05544p n=1 Tax=Zygosaccharomyces rouxii (strain ATCC 2623 / CBS 732 / NBRC 1130 / NCYC 568 / NRRL Y-229) TaxID=559307 RepID=C5E4F5_ZYGRC|nr:uncharacterized protein ZYRO0E05544g [Zygosaccharomyces rouxii]KAH9198226.1 hypothetical protein LQ764DRAFT_226671 [Zygosaccharomyces rouxii]CAR30916.1 ZYRO0E05544p [Zygosaccharomyces rouxii]
MSIKEIALDLTVFTLTSVNDAISFKPQLCFEVPKQDYQQLKEDYINFTGTSIRKNRSKLFFLPTNVSDELQKLNASVPESAKRVPNDGRVYYKNRLITELDYENVKRVETACAFIAYTALNSFVHFETDVKGNASGNGDHESVPMVSTVSAGTNTGSSGSSVDIDGTSSNTVGNGGDDDDENEEVSSSESVTRALKKGNILGFRELGHLVGITPWHFHRVFKVITGLTIREYGQLCVEFIKKNKELINACRVRVVRFKLTEHYSCLDDTHFLRDGGLQYPATENVVLLPDYFIDPNKSKEFKKRKSSTKPVQEEVNYGVTQRSQIRKRRSSVVYGRIQRASQNTITSNSLNDCLTSPTTTRRSVSFPRSDEENINYNYDYGYNYKNDGNDNVNGNNIIDSNFGNQIENDTFNNYHYSNTTTNNNFDNDTDESTSASSDWERPIQNVFPPLSMATPRPTSPAITSRKNSIISIGSAGAAASASNNKVSKKGGNLMEAHRRNRSDGLGLNLDSLRDGSIDHKLSMATTSAGTAVGGDNGNANTSTIEFNNNIFQNDDAEDVDFTNLDYNSSNNIFQKQFKLDPKYPYPSNSSDTNVDSKANSVSRSSGSAAAAAIAAFSGVNGNGNNNDSNGNSGMEGVPSMTDISLFNNSLLEQTTTPAASLLLDTDPTSASTGIQEELDVDTLLNNSSSLLDELVPFSSHPHHHHNHQPQRKDGIAAGELFSMPEENELFDTLNGDLLAGDALLSFEH